MKKFKLVLPTLFIWILVPSQVDAQASWNPCTVKPKRIAECQKSLENRETGVAELERGLKAKEEALVSNTELRNREVTSR